METPALWLLIAAHMVMITHHVQEVLQHLQSGIR